MPSSRALRQPPRPLASAGLVAVWFAALALAPAGALGAGPTTTTVTVVVLGDEAHDPLDGALVTLTGSTADEPEPVYEADATTGADGSATFGAVPLAAGGAPVDLVAAASKSESATVDGCTTQRTWSGSSGPVTAAADLAIEVLASRTDETACDDPGPSAPVLRGLVVGPDGSAFDVFEASVEMTRADGATWSHPLEIGGDGRLTAVIQAWGTLTDPAHLAVAVIGSVVGHETDGDCTYDLAPRATFEEDVSLADGHDPSEVALVATIDRVGAVCGTSGTPRPTATAPGAAGGGSTPAATLPPTDPIASAPPASAPPPDVAPLALAALGLGAAAAVGLLRRLRRRLD